MANDRQLTQHLLTQLLNGAPNLVGTITSTGSAKDNSSTGVAFTLESGAVYMAQPDADCYIARGTTGMAAASSTTGIKILQDTVFYLTLTPTDTLISMISNSGTANLRVFRML